MTTIAVLPPPTNLGIQEGTVAANFKLAIDKMGKNVNNNIPIINQLLNPILVAMGDPDVQTYLVSNTTLQNEAASLIAVKNASGTTVYDKMEAAGLVPKNATVEQQKEIVQRLEQEAENARNVLNQQNSSLYQQIDPLEQLPQNPNRIKTINGGYTDTVDYLKQHPEAESLIDQIGRENPTMNDSDLLQAGKALGLPGFSQPQATGLNSPITKVISEPVGESAGQCGRWVNKLTGLGVGDSYQSKLDKMDSGITQPE